MESLFLKLLNMSINAVWIVLAVCLVRQMKFIPKWVNVVLWGFVGFRLVCPFSIESIFSLIPSSESVVTNDFVSNGYSFNSGFNLVDKPLNSILQSNVNETTNALTNDSVSITFIIGLVWIVGIALMFSYAFLSFLKVKRQVTVSTKLTENVWICDDIPAPFILGVIRPKIYIPSNLNEECMPYVISHEKAHIKRLDYVWKPLGFILLSIYWFNPFMWLAYCLLSRDIEMACDESVLKHTAAKTKKSYSNALIECSVQNKILTACPLAFGEVGVKERVKNVINYKKPTFWIITISVVLCVVVAVCFLTNPSNSKENIDTSGERKTTQGAEAVASEINTLGNIDKIDFKKIFDETAGYGIGYYGNIDLQHSGPIDEISWLKDLKIGKKEISDNQISDRDKANIIALRRDIDDESFEFRYVYFSDDFSLVGLDDRANNSSYLYKVLEPEKAKKFFGDYTEEMKNLIPTEEKGEYISYGVPEQNMLIHKDIDLGTFEKPHKLEESVRLRHTDINSTDTINYYDYNVTFEQILEGKKAEQKLKETCTNFEAAKYALVENDLYLIKVNINYNPESKIKNRLPIDIDVAAVNSRGIYISDESHFANSQYTNETVNGKVSNWYPLLVPKGVDFKPVFVMGDPMVYPGAVAAVYFEK